MANSDVSSLEPPPQNPPGFPLFSSPATGGQSTSLSSCPDEPRQDISPSKDARWSGQIPQNKRTRAVSGKDSSAERRMHQAKSRRRTQTSEKAHRILQFWLQLDPFPNRQEKQALATLCKLTYDQVNNWFNNHRQRQKPENPAHPLHQQINPPASISGSDSAYQSLTTTTSSATIPPQRKPYQCTFGCDIRFSSRSDFRRHEEIHCPQNEWICCYKLPSSFSEEDAKCAFCHETNPTPNHIDREHNCQPCLDKPRTFRRKDKFQLHLATKHNQSFITSNMESWCRPIASKFNRRCGFCGHWLKTWLERINHIADHFSEGWDMSQWQEPWVELQEPRADQDRDGGDPDHEYGGGSPGGDSGHDSEDSSGGGPGDSSGDSLPDDPQSPRWNPEGRQRRSGPEDQLRVEGKIDHDTPASSLHHHIDSSLHLIYGAGAWSDQIRDCAGRYRDLDFEELSLAPGRSLGKRTFSAAEEATSREVRLARRTISWKRRPNLSDIAMNEVKVLQRLHQRHIIQFVGGSYPPGTSTIFLNPIAHCDLREFMDEYSQRPVSGHTRLDNLGKHAVQHIHMNSIRHFDPRPQNKITSDRIILTTPTYRMPEVYKGKTSRKLADRAAGLVSRLSHLDRSDRNTVSGFHQQQSLDRRAKSPRTHSSFILPCFRMRLTLRPRVIRRTLNPRYTGYIESYRPVEERADTEVKTYAALQAAAHSGDMIAVQQLLRQCDNAATEDNPGETALHWAAGNGHEGGVRTPTKNGADIVAKTCSGEWALHQAAWSGHEAVVRLLIETGTNVDTNGKTKDARRQAPLWWATTSNQRTLVESLLGKRARIAEDNSQTTILLAVSHDHEVLMRLPLGGTAEIELYSGANCRHEALLKLLVKKGDDMGSRDAGNQTPPPWTVGRSKHEAEPMVRSPLEEKFDTDTMNLWTAVSSPRATMQSPITVLLPVVICYNTDKPDRPNKHTTVPQLEGSRPASGREGANGRGRGDHTPLAPTSLPSIEH
jgi:ankyrin repeat protein